jgi:hypothetical protein
MEGAVEGAARVQLCGSLEGREQRASSAARRREGERQTAERERER